MKIVLPGGSGQVGTLLARAFFNQGHEVVVLSRRPAGAPWRTVRWNGTTLDEWVGEFEAADAVVNLAGRGVNCRYHARNREEIMRSRVESTLAVGQAIARAKRPPRVWLQMSTATIYAHRYDAPNDEQTGILGGEEPGAPDTWRFSIDVARAWERQAREAVTPQTRKLILRSAMVMSPDRGSVFDTLLGLVRRGLGGKVGDGRQFVSWIHGADFVRAIGWLIGRDDVCGAVNICSPHPIPYAAFMRTLREAWGARWGLPAAVWMLELSTWLLRTESELVLKSRRVIPRRLLDGGFAFEFPEWSAAARDLCARWRSKRNAEMARAGKLSDASL